MPPSIRLTGTGKRNATVKVTSSGVTSVHCIDNEYTGGDGFLILPVAQLGKQYYAVSYTLRVNNPSIICVSALDQETSVHITIKDGQTFLVTLAPYESYCFDGDVDLTGTFIECSNPVTVISAVYTEISSCCKSAVIGQMFPVHSWKCSYIMYPCLGRSSGYIYRIMSSNQAAVVEINI